VNQHVIGQHALHLKDVQILVELPLQRLLAARKVDYQLGVQVKGACRLNAEMRDWKLRKGV